MSKAIEGAAEIGLAVGFFAAAALIPGAAFLVGSLVVDDIIAGIGVLGVGMEAGAIADAIAGNRGENITTRQPASPRQIIYGTQRVGGVEIFETTTGSSHDQFNFVIVIATHEVFAIENMYLDGRQIFWQGSGVGWGLRNGYGFGGIADGGTHVGPGGQSYNFGGTGSSGIYVEARYGDQLPGDVIGGLTANDSRWSADSTGSPYLGGCTYVYFKAEYNQTLFPSKPAVKFTVKGKPVYDPRLGETTYSDNWALIVNDVLTDPEYGIGDIGVNQAQLIAAANICDEQVPLAAGGTEARYACHFHFDTSMAPGDVLDTLMGAAGGRISRIGNEWYIWPAAYIGPSLSLNTDHVIDKPTWSSKRSYRELFNRVNGTYIAPNYPYNAESGLSDLYDTNGWFDNSIENTFPFAFQPTNFPQYACDTLHGYAADQYLNQDGGVQLPKEMTLSSVLSVAQAQRLAKIALLRNRQQGTGSFTMNLAAFQLQPCDTFYMTFPQRGWANKLLEVNKLQFVVDSPEGGQAPQVKVVLDVNETDPSVYEWEATEELTVLDVPAAPQGISYTTEPPTDVVVVSGPGTAIYQPDGTAVPRIQVNWNTPLDVRVSQIQVQYQAVGTGVWNDGGTVAVAVNTAYITPVVAGLTYDVRIRSLRPNGGTSIWVEVDGNVAGLVFSVQTENGIGIGSLVGEAFSDGTAGIVCDPFVAPIGSRQVSYFLGGAVTLTGLQQQRLYWVYLVDPSAQGGNLTPVATLTEADFAGKPGYWLIDSIVTPYQATSGGGTGGGTTTATRYAPTSYSDTGSRTTRNPAYAYDGNLSTSAVVSGSGTETQASGPDGPTGPVRYNLTSGNCTWSFGAGTTAAAMTLTILASVTMTTSSQATLSATVGGTTTVLWAPTSTTAQQTLTLAIPSGTDLSTVSVNATASGNPQSVGDTETASLSVTEIYIQ